MPQNDSEQSQQTHVWSSLADVIGNLLCDKDADARVVQLQREVAAAGEALAASQAAVAAASSGEKEAALQGRLKEVEGLLAVEAAGKADADSREAVYGDFSPEFEFSQSATHQQHVRLDCSFVNLHFC
jgi:hypothetical protein